MIVRRLLQLNREISAGERAYDPFVSGAHQETLMIGREARP